MRKATAKWQKRAARYLLWRQKDFEAATAFRKRFKQSKMDKAISQVERSL